MFKKLHDLSAKKSEAIKKAKNAWAQGNIAMTVEMVTFVIGVFIITLFLGLLATGTSTAYTALNTSFSDAATVINNLPTLVVALLFLGIVVAGTAYFYKRG